MRIALNVLMEKMNQHENKPFEMSCPLCGETHRVIKRTIPATACIKGEDVAYEQEVWICQRSPVGENEFIPGDVMDRNLRCARNAYRKKHGMLQSHEIVAIREYYGLTQKELSKLLGWGEATIARYETKFIQEQAHDEILQEIRENAMFAQTCLEKNKASFDETRYGELHSLIADLVRQTSSIYHIKMALEAQYLDYVGHDDFTGASALNLDKVCGMADFFAKKSSKQLFKVKLMKLLWYADAVSFRDFGHSISGLVYQHKPMGALPIGHYELLSLIPHEEVYDNFELASYRILPKHDGALEKVLSPDELSVLEKMLARFDKFTGQQLAEYMHREDAYRKTLEDDIIPYSLAKSVSI